jgi:hypothetical protein
MSNEIIYQYNGQVHLRDEPVFDGEEMMRIPTANEIIARRGTHYRVRSVKILGTRSRNITQHVVDLAPMYPLAD